MRCIGTAQAHNSSQASAPAHGRETALLVAERVDCATCLQSSAEGLFTLPDPSPAQTGADSPYPIEGPLPTLSNGEPDAEVQPAYVCMLLYCLHVCSPLVM